MNIKVFEIVIFISSVLLVTNCLPSGNVNYQIYKMVPLGKIVTHDRHNLGHVLHRLRGSVVKRDLGDKEKNIEELKIYTGRLNGPYQINKKTELLKTDYRYKRDSENRPRYMDQDYAYDDSDWAGYDKKGHDVGYMDDNDNFPTVVW